MTCCHAVLCLLEVAITHYHFRPTFPPVHVTLSGLLGAQSISTCILHRLGQVRRVNNHQRFSETPKTSHSQAETAASQKFVLLPRKTPQALEKKSMLLIARLQAGRRVPLNVAVLNHPFAFSGLALLPNLHTKGPAQTGVNRATRPKWCLMKLSAAHQ